MFKNRIQAGLAAIVLAVGLVTVAILSLFAYIGLTTAPLHPDPDGVPSVNGSAPLPQWAAAVDRGRQIVRAGVIEQNVPGASVAVGVRGDVVWAEGFGWADLDKRVRVTPKTRFRIGQVSNTLTSAAAGLLLERDALNLDAEIQTYVPEFPKQPWPVTTRLLMGHLAGVVPDEGDEEPLEEHCERAADGLPRFSK